MNQGDISAHMGVQGGNERGGWWWDSGKSCLDFVREGHLAAWEGVGISNKLMKRWLRRFLPLG